MRRKRSSKWTALTLTDGPSVSTKPRISHVGAVAAVVAVGAVAVIAGSYQPTKASMSSELIAFLAHLSRLAIA